MPIPIQPNSSPLAFPKAADVPRLQGYDEYDKIYSGQHFDAFSIKAEKDFSDKYARLRYIVANFGGLMSRVLADMLFGEKITVDMEDNQEFIDALMQENSLINQLYESALCNSRRGDDLFKIRVGTRNIENVSEKATVIIEQVSAALYFPEFDNANARNTPSKDVLVWTFQLPGSTSWYLHKEIHTPGYIAHEIYSYNPDKQMIIAQLNAEDFGFQPLEETGVDRSLVFYVPNVRDGNGFFGTSDYKDLIPLFFALNNRITKIDNILDKHSDPILAVPPGVIDEKGQVKKESLGMFEVDNENPGFNKPEYIVWNANLDTAMSQVDKLIDLLFMFSEIAPATMGADKDGQAESGRALKFKLIATIRKRNRKKNYYDQMIKDMLQTCQDLAIAQGVAVGGIKITESERPKIDWGDGIIMDETELVANSVARVDAGLSSRADEIARLDGLTPQEAEAKVKEIDAESATKVPAITPNPNSVFATPPDKATQPTPPTVKPVVVPPTATPAVPAGK